MRNRVRRLRLLAAAATLITAGSAIAIAPAAVSGPETGIGVRAADCASDIQAHRPIAVNVEADWTSANGVTGGSGTQGDPYVIECWAIDVPTGGSGIKIGSDAASRAFVIRDVYIAKDAGAGGTTYGVQIAAAPQATQAEVIRSTMSGLTYGINTTRVGGLRLASNTLADNTWGIQDSGSPTIVIEGNIGIGNGLCINRTSAAGDHAQVTDNVCRNSSGNGFQLSAGGDQTAPGLIATGNLAEGNGKNGFLVSSGVLARHNISRSNANGYFVTGSALVDQNRAEANTGAGIEISAATYATISDNVIVGNGSVGIIADPAEAQGFYAYSTDVVGNHIGNNPFGIVLFGFTALNQVWGTDWTDGQPTYGRFVDANTIVDAGTDKRGSTSSPVNFADYIAQVSAGHGTPNPALQGQGLGTIPALLSPRLSVVTSIVWDFGNESGCAPQTITDPGQGHGPSQIVSCIYDSPGRHTATMTVNGMDSNGQPASLSDTVPVDISQGA